MLADAEPLGLPGCKIRRVAFQSESRGYHLDDVIVHAIDANGASATLEVQAKRNITFAPQDPVFQKVAGQIAKAVQEPGFWDEIHDLGVATAALSTKISTHYRDVLRWTRHVGDAVLFFDQLERVGHKDMRSFVETLRTHLSEFGVESNDDHLFQILRRLHILSLDLTAPDSIFELLNLERARMVLNSSSAGDARSLWHALNQIALRFASDGGDLTRERLIDELKQLSIHLTGAPQTFKTRKLIRESSQHALDDIDDTIGSVFLPRTELLDKVCDAIDEGHCFIEIRGAGGVGKSGILKHIAKIYGSDSTIVVLNPDRTPTGGWAALRSQLGFQGLASELFYDLACDGGAVLLIDNLDGFNAATSKTIIDIVREAAKIPGFTVICTVRSDYGVDGTAWLPADAISALNPGDPVFISPLTDQEISTLRQADPSLYSLLNTEHPAADLTRNLFRLSRLLERRGAYSSDARTEIDMLSIWWETADSISSPDPNLRRRGRVLAYLAKTSIDRAPPFDTTLCEAAAVDALIHSGTLREHSRDRMTFRHDVLNEWAVASLLIDDKQNLSLLPLSRPASSIHARAVELTSRHALEREPETWNHILDALSDEPIHPTWRRAALLALVRSEKSNICLDQQREILTADDGRLLRELIRTVMAVEVRPAVDILEASGVDSSTVPEGLTVPSGPSCARLVGWILKLDDDLPPVVIPDAADLLLDFLIWAQQETEVAALIVRQLFKWLTEIEAANSTDYQSLRLPFDGAVEFGRAKALEMKLRPAILHTCHLTPDLGQAYARSLLERPFNDPIVHDVVAASGTLAHVAPAELAELTARALIESSAAGKSEPRNRSGPFTYIDTAGFFSADPKKGPFYQLLTSSPEVGLKLIRRLADHAVTFYFEGKSPDEDTLIIKTQDGERRFPWTITYRWSREDAEHHGLTSALMALELWAHERIEKGENFDSVIADVLGEDNAPAAYVLIAVDLIISHWPKSRSIAIPFLGCPALLAIEHSRPVLDEVNRVRPRLGGFSQEGPIRLNSLSTLEALPSRKTSLSQVLSYFAIFGAKEEQNAILVLLSDEAERLGKPHPQSDFSDAAFMTQHALNCLDPENYTEKSIEAACGSVQSGWEYVSPAEEAAHLEALQTSQLGQMSDVQMTAAISIALDDRTRSSSELAQAAASWPHKDKGSDSDSESDAGLNWTAAAALIVVRDGTDALFSQHKSWARQLFVELADNPSSDVVRHRPGLAYNEAAIAFAGLAHILVRAFDQCIVKTLLALACRRKSCAASGFSATVKDLAELDERLPRAILRCALSSAHFAWFRWDVSDEEKHSWHQKDELEKQTLIDAELAWLFGDGPEPAWPDLLPERPRKRQGLRVPGARSEVREVDDVGTTRKIERTDYQFAAYWLEAVVELASTQDVEWLPAVLTHFVPWTCQANGVVLGEDVSVGERPFEWNQSFYSGLARCVPFAPSPFVDEVALPAILDLPDDAFCDAVVAFILPLDAMYLDMARISEANAVRIREAIAKRMLRSRGWRRLGTDRKPSIEMGLAPAAACLFFSVHRLRSQPQCYLRAADIEKLSAFMPLIDKLTVSAPSHFVAMAALSLFETAPRKEHLLALVACARSWIAHFGEDSDFWLESAIGKRWCNLISMIITDENNDKLLTPDLCEELDNIVAELVRFGVADASWLEEKISGLDS